MQLILGQLEDKQMPPNVPPKVFKNFDASLVKLQIFNGKIYVQQGPQNVSIKVFNKVDTSHAKMHIKFGLGNKKVPKPSIGQKSS